MKNRKFNISNRDIKIQNSVKSSATDLSVEVVEELTIEKVFEDYKGEPFQSKLIEFEPVGNEKW
ncbi:hypothetical protein CBF34_10375 [Vagococcus penaei]|uniref:Uncharacterized protein n=2 Tax=Vagococcus penaei TaxID=633807 RepID=A0A1Q2D682_9ENTE|nr:MULTISPECIES: hypothetical protein [Vagococcus]AQP53821.1 hypothetical protein BW732_05935 [Vagococcus penaei]MBO0436216.1 hypothetical protein [Vagococcus fluvialis]RST98351.1 hypothetical protein CBF34_10375 [Vagococcus penaei]